MCSLDDLRSSLMHFGGLNGEAENFSGRDWNIRSECSPLNRDQPYAHEADDEELHMEEQVHATQAGDQVIHDAREVDGKGLQLEEQVHAMQAGHQVICDAREVDILLNLKEDMLNRDQLYAHEADDEELQIEEQVHATQAGDQVVHDACEVDGEGLHLEEQVHATQAGHQVIRDAHEINNKEEQQHIMEYLKQRFDSSEKHVKQMEKHVKQRFDSLENSDRSLVKHVKQMEKHVKRMEHKFASLKCKTMTRFGLLECRTMKRFDSVECSTMKKLNSMDQQISNVSLDLSTSVEIQVRCAIQRALEKAALGKSTLPSILQSFNGVEDTKELRIASIYDLAKYLKISDEEAHRAMHVGLEKLDVAGFVNMLKAFVEVATKTINRMSNKENKKATNQECLKALADLKYCIEILNVDEAWIKKVSSILSTLRKHGQASKFIKFISPGLLEGLSVLKKILAHETDLQMNIQKSFPFMFLLFGVTNHLINEIQLDMQGNCKRQVTENQTAYEVVVGEVKRTYAGLDTGRKQLKRFRAVVQAFLQDLTTASHCINELTVLKFVIVVGSREKHQLAGKHSMLQNKKPLIEQLILPVCDIL